MPRTFWRDAIYSVRRPILYVVRPRFSGQAANLAAKDAYAETALFATAGHALFVDEAARFNLLHGRVHPPPGLAVVIRSLLPLFLISGAAVGYEIALTRYFAVAKWSEYGYWVISIVMAGFALSRRHGRAGAGGDGPARRGAAALAAGRG